jgi:hypothetical protein
MSSYKNGIAAASENVTKRPHKNVTLEENIQAIRRRSGNHIVLFVGF